MVNTKTSSLPWNQERLKRSIPVPEAMPAGYRQLLKKKKDESNQHQLHSETKY